MDIPGRGSCHRIRHSYAVFLLRNGTPVKTIGDLLGHRSLQSTWTYLRLAIEDLRDVALPVPEESTGQKAVRLETDIRLSISTALDHHSVPGT